MKQLSQSEIRYLSFEGGGGAGNAYPGALVGLEDVGIIEYDPQRANLDPAVSLSENVTGIDWRVRGQIEGVSGASAGAINALFLSLGYTPAEAEYILATNDFDNFFDTPTPGLNPHVGGFRVDYTAYDLATFYDQFSATTGGLIVNQLTRGFPFSAIHLEKWAATALGQFWSGMLLALLVGLAVEFPEKAAKQVLRNLTNSKVPASAVFDFGIFPGIEIRKFFARYISVAVERMLQNDPRYTLKSMPAAVAPSSINVSFGQSLFDTQTRTWVQTSEITFRQHQEIFGNRLLVTGTNLETMKSHFFSADTTPNFRVVDAVRISMSLPMIFKPLVIKDDADLKAVMTSGESLTDHYLKGVWVDGGLLNNIPVTAFDELADGQEHTLGLVVGIEERSEITNIVGFLKVWPLGMFMGTGDSQVSATTMNVDRIIVLDTRDAISGQTLGLLDFKLDQKLYDNIKAQSKKTVTDFFATRVQQLNKP